MEFFKAEVSDTTYITIAYSSTSVAEPVLDHCRRVIVLLSKSVAAAQRHPTVDEKRIDAALQSLIGFAALSVGEAAAVLALVSVGLERQSRVHLRALHEYVARIELLLGDPEKAYQFKIAAAIEAERFANMMQDKVSAEKLAASKSKFLSDLEGEVPKKEKDVIGDMRTVMEKLRPGSYAANFAFLSLVSHGSIVALNEMSTALSSAGEDITKKIGIDGQAGLYLFDMCGSTLQICLHLMKELKVNIGSEFDELNARNEALAKEYGIVPQSTVSEQINESHPVQQ